MSGKQTDLTAYEFLRPEHFAALRKEVLVWAEDAR